MCQDSCLSNSFLIRVTGQLSHRVRRENSFPYYRSIPPRASPAHCLPHAGRGNFFRASPLTGRTVELSDERLNGWRARCSFNSMTACMSGFTRVGVNTSLLDWLCCTLCVSSAPPSVELLEKHKACQRG